MAELESKWKPSSDITTHKGDKIPYDLIFFTPPPKDIVNLRSAASNVKNGKVIQDKGSVGFAVKLLAGIGIGLMGGLLIGALAATIFQIEALMLIIAAIVGAGILAFILRCDFSTPAVCSYVGDSGIANNVLKKEPNPKKGIGLFLFHQAEELRVVKVQIFTNGIYTSTAYRFDWKKANGEIVFNINGEHRSREDNPPPLDRYYFALAAEKAWSLFKFELIHQELKQNGKVTFNIGNKDAIVIAQGYVELIKRGQSSRLDGNEIKEIGLSGGIIHVIPKEVKSRFLGFGSDGIWRINYSDIANARIFMLIFDMLINQK